MAGIAFTPRFMSLRRKEHLALPSNATHQLPFIEDGRVRLSESHAILTYLWTTRDCADHWYPRDPATRATCDQLLHWHHSGLRCVERYLHYWLEERQHGNAPEGLTSVYLSEMHNALSRLDTWLEGKRFMLGGEISIYDLSAVCEVAEMKLVPGLFAESMEKYKRLREWFDCVYAITEVRSAHEIVERIVAKYKL